MLLCSIRTADRMKGKEITRRRVLLIDIPILYAAYKNDNTLSPSLSHNNIT